MDIWKGNYRGNPVCIKALRIRSQSALWKLKLVRNTFFSRKCTQHVSYQTFRHAVEKCKSKPHPNVVPIIEVSETLVPFFIMSPWKPDGNIAHYIQMNPSANRLMLVCTHKLKYG